MANKTYFHAIKLIDENCTGCTKCVRVCPTEALRVRNGKVILDENRCIDCGKCIQVCPFRAIIPMTDNLQKMTDFKYKVALVSTSYAGQFPQSTGYDKALQAILKLGFDEVAEESAITGQVNEFIREYINYHPETRPLISSNCPSVVRLIQVRFPDLLPHILPIESPMAMLSAYFRNKICAEKNLKNEEIGIFLIVPCISQVTAVHQPEGTNKHLQNGAISISEIYSNIMNSIRHSKPEDKEFHSHPSGLGWAISSLQAEELNDGKIKTLAVSGIDNVIEILAKIENQQLERFDYVVLSSCLNGCVGGILNVENPFVATTRIKDIMRKAKPEYFAKEIIREMYENGDFDVLELEPRSIMTLDKDIKTALEKMKKIDEITDKLPGLDCSACGSPNCRALAEDIVAGKATMKDCVVLLRMKIK